MKTIVSIYGLKNIFLSLGEGVAILKKPKYFEILFYQVMKKIRGEGDG
jgi:hypothetical protein